MVGRVETLTPASAKLHTARLISFVLLDKTSCTGHANHFDIGSCQQWFAIFARDEMHIDVEFWSRLHTLSSTPTLC